MDDEAQDQEPTQMDTVSSKPEKDKDDGRCEIRRKIEDYLDFRRYRDEFGFDDLDDVTDYA